MRHRLQAVDKFVESKNADVITSIPERKYMYQGQTPQSFKISSKRLYGDLSMTNEPYLPTLAANMRVMRDQPVKLVRDSLKFKNYNRKRL